MTPFHPTHFFDLPCFSHNNLFEGITNVWEALLTICEYLDRYPLGVIKTQVPSQAYLVQPEKISIGEGTIIEPGAYIKGPCILGSHCVVRHGAYVRGNCIVGDHCVIGHDTELKSSILLDGASAAHFAYVGDSILGNRCNLGAGVKLANLKLKGEVVSFFHQGRVYDTGMRKLGAIIGDRTQLGCNAVTNPGTLLGPDVLCYPCVNVGGVVPQGQTIKNIYMSSGEISR